jgi:cell wall-associated NlpC family hydrolase
VFFGTVANTIIHVGIYLGRQADQDMMIDTPNAGSVVRVEPFPTTIGTRRGSEIYLGATAPGSR